MAGAHRLRRLVLLHNSPMAYSLLRRLPLLLSVPGLLRLLAGLGYVLLARLFLARLTLFLFQQPQPMSNGDYGVRQTEVNAKPVSNLLDPDWHLKRAEYLYKKGDRKGAEEATKRSLELRNENFKQDEAANKAPVRK